MSNESLAAKAVAMGPQTVAPPSFDGHGWLVALNLGMFTAGFIICAMLASEQAKYFWRDRRKRLWETPIQIGRLALFNLCFAVALRCGAAAATLWRWDPEDPVGTAFALTAQRFVDPVALAFGLSGIMMLVLAARGLVDQLEREPLAVDIWPSLPMLWRPLTMLAASLVAAILVVSLR